MILIEKNSNGHLFKIGKHVLELENSVMIELARLLTPEYVRDIAHGEVEWRNGSWWLEEAHDDNPNRESRVRILLHHGDLKWHLTQEEVINLGISCRSLQE